MEYTLRTARAADVPYLQQLLELSVRSLQAGDYGPAEINAAVRTIFTVDTRLVADGTYFVVEAPDGTFAACGGWSRRKTLYGGDAQVEAKEPELLDPAKDAAKIRAIFVHPDHARKGLGSLVLRTAEEAAAAEGFRELEMGATLTGYPVYLKHGYVEIERHHAPVGGGLTVEVVRMRKRI
ncbi:GNAT family N-acetyltransferase [Terriglobus albidus]|uniref:GNAT family N-acetyltransferase n=1 Tax=Terriglobus albidus TaxID=1592106 RepID=UPI0021E0E530|nr:GNAT family N-acetyltransferase [Terriglobus albidus]